MCKKIDHEYADEIVCPYCGYEWIDSWEEGMHSGAEDIGLLQCPECEKTFVASRCIEVTYTTMPYGTCEKCGKENVTLDEAPFIFDGLVCYTCWKYGMSKLTFSVDGEKVKIPPLSVDKEEKK